MPVVLAAMVLLFIWQVVMITHISMPIGWDVFTVVSSALGLTAEKSAYFTRYPNNLFLVFVLRTFEPVFRLVGKEDIWLTLSVFNTLVVDLSFIMAIFLARRIYGTLTAYATLALSVLLLSLFPWIIVPYSDTLSMPFVIGTLCCYEAVCRAKTIGRKAILGVCMAIVFVCGAMIKPTVMIIVVAIVLMHMLYTLARARDFRGQLLWMLPSIGVAAILFVGLQHFMTVQTYIPIERGKSAPLSHFMSMGMTEYGRFHGAYSYDDAAFTFSFDTTEEMDKANRARIQEKLEERGALGYLKFLTTKARWVMAEGTFSWGFDGDFSLEYTRPQSLFTDLFFRNERYHQAYLHMAQAIWIVIFTLMTSLVWTDRMKVANRYTTIMQCGIFGLLLYLLLFEARARYLINYLPLFVLLAGHGYTGLARMIRRARKDKPAIANCAQPQDTV